MADLREALLNGENLHVSEELSKHADWADAFMARHPEFNAENAEAIIQYEIGQVFAAGSGVRGRLQVYRIGQSCPETIFDGGSKWLTPIIFPPRPHGDRRQPHRPSARLCAGGSS